MASFFLCADFVLGVMREDWRPEKLLLRILCLLLRPLNRNGHFTGLRCNGLGHCLGLVRIRRNDE
jgi:hypothetical protein